MRKIKQLQSDQAEIEEAIQNLKDVVAANLPLGETVLGDENNGYLKAVVYQAKQFNEAYGKKERPDLWEKAAVQTKVLTSARAKEVFGDQSAEYAAFQKPSAKVSVKV